MLSAVTLAKISDEILQIGMRVLRGLAAAGQWVFAYACSATLDLLAKKLEVLARQEILLPHDAQQTFEDDHALVARTG